LELGMRWETNIQTGVQTWFTFTNNICLKSLKDLAWDEKQKVQTGVPIDWV
jgi:hypothetical protein